MGHGAMQCASRIWFCCTRVKGDNATRMPSGRLNGMSRMSKILSHAKEFICVLECVNMTFPPRLDAQQMVPDDWSDGPIIVSMYLEQPRIVLTLVHSSLAMILNSINLRRDKRRFPGRGTLGIDRNTFIRIFGNVLRVSSLFNQRLSDRWGISYFIAVSFTNLDSCLTILVIELLISWW